MSISWKVACNGKDQVLEFRWEEWGGGEVAAPARHAFGTTLLKGTFGGARVDYAAEGLRCEIDVPFSDIRRGTAESADMDAQTDRQSATRK